MITQEQLNTYKEMVNDNQHTEVLVKVARDLKLGYYEGIFSSILSIHNDMEYLDSNLAIFRYTVKSDMLEQIKIEYSPELSHQLAKII